MANTWNTANQTYNNVTYTMPGAVGPHGSLLTSTGSNGTSWTNPNTNFNSTNGKAILTIPHGEEKVVVEETATLEVKGNIKINGIDLEERLKTIERVLMIPERDATMEAKYPSLKKKYEEYIKELSKYRMWDTIKGNDYD